MITKKKFSLYLKGRNKQQTNFSQQMLIIQVYCVTQCQKVIIKVSPTKTCWYFTCHFDFNSFFYCLFLSFFF